MPCAHGLVDTVTVRNCMSSRIAVSGDAKRTRLFGSARRRIGGSGEVFEESRATLESGWCREIAAS